MVRMQETAAYNMTECLNLYDQKDTACRLTKKDSGKCKSFILKISCPSCKLTDSGVLCSFYK